MKELLRVTLNAKQIREACEEWVDVRTSVAEPASVSVTGIADDAAVAVVYVKRRERKAKAKEKANGVASAQPLSPAEERFA